MTGKSKNGAYNGPLTDLSRTNISDLQNPWNLYALFFQPDDLVYVWLGKINFIVESIKCEKCSAICTLFRRAGRGEATHFDVQTTKTMNIQCLSTLILNVVTQTAETF